jgi:hypothetical protein
MTAVLETIRKLLALANDEGAAPGEVEAALGRAAHLQRQHGLTDEQISRHVHRDVDGLHIGREAVAKRQLFGGSRIGRHDAWIAYACALAVCCRTYISHGGADAHAARITAFGLPEDVAVAAELFAFAKSAMAKAVQAYCKQKGINRSHPDAKAFADGFCLGLREAAKRALAAAQNDTEEVAVRTDTGTALVVVSNALVTAKLAAVSAYETDLCLRRGRRYRARGGDGYNAGHDAGAATSLGRNVIS